MILSFLDLFYSDELLYFLIFSFLRSMSHYIRDEKVCSASCHIICVIY